MNNATIVCPDCRGNEEVCLYCEGSGSVTKYRQQPGLPQYKDTCDKCNGRGIIVCKTCSGAGKILVNSSQLDIKLGEVIKSAYDIVPLGSNRNLIDEVKNDMINLVQQGANINGYGVLENIFEEDGAYYVYLIKLAIELGADINKNVYKGNCLISYLVDNLNSDIVKQNISKIHDINSQNYNGNSYLHKVSFADNPSYETIEILIKNGADVNIKNKEGYTPLHYASENKKSNEAIILIENGADVNAKTSKGKSPLFMVFGLLYNFYDDVVEYSKANRIILKTCSVDKFARNKFRDIMLILQILLKKNVDLNGKDSEGLPCLSSIIFYINNLKSDYKVNKKKLNLDSFHKFLIKSLEEITEVLILEGANVNAKNNDGITPLFYASGNIVKLLIEHGADINIKDNFGWTPISFMIFNDRLESAQLLLDKGADTTLNSKSNNENHCNSLYYAISSKQGGEFLLKNNIKVLYEINDDGNTALMFFCKREEENVEVIRFFIDQGVNLKVKNKDKKKALDLAKENNHIETFKILKKELSNKGKIFLFILLFFIVLGYSQYDFLKDKYEKRLIKMEKYLTKLYVNEVKKNSLNINVSPTNTTIKVLNIKPIFRQGIQLKEGKYHIQISKSGYETYQKWIIINKDTNLNISLTPFSQEAKCNSGDSKACYDEATKYYKGNGVSQNFKKATKLYEKGCNKGNNSSCLNLGVMYYKGEGVSENISKAKTLLHKACTLGNKKACENYKILN